MSAGFGGQTVALSGDYTLSQADSEKSFVYSGTVDIVLKIPKGLSNFKTGKIIQKSTGKVTVAPCESVKVNSLNLAKSTFGKSTNLTIEQVGVDAFDVMLWHAESSDSSRFASPYGMFETRRVIPGYTGPAFKLRRTTNNQKLDFYFGATGYIDQDAIISWASGGGLYVSIWYDQSGNGRHATAAGLSTEPIFDCASSDIYIYFDGTKRLPLTNALGFTRNKPSNAVSLIASAHIDNQTWAVGAAVGAAGNGVFGAYLFGNSGTTWNCFAKYSSATSNKITGGPSSVIAKDTGNKLMLAEANWLAANTSFTVAGLTTNSQSIDSGSASTPDVDAGYQPCIGGSADGASFFTGSIAHVGFFDYALDAATKNSIVNQLGTLNPSGFGGLTAQWGDSLTTPAVGAAVSTYGPRDQQGGGYAGKSSIYIRAQMLADVKWNQRIVILWQGRNNYRDTPNTILDDLAAQVAYVVGGKFLVLSILNSGPSSEPDEILGGANYNKVIALNNQIQAAYPNNYLDVRKMLVNAYNPAVPQDVIDFANDRPPSSLRSDDLHLNTAGYSLVGKWIAEFIRSKGW